MTTEKTSKTRIHTVYKTKDGTRVPSVTTILGILNKPALLDWAWKLGTEGIDYKAVRDKAGDIGTLAHYLIMSDIKGEKPDTTEYSAQDIDKAETCLLKYWDWRKTNPIKPILVEHALVSEQYRYGGTIDCLAELNGKPVLIDWKTSKGIYDEMIMQVCAYKYLLEENCYPVENVRILRISKDDFGDFEDRIINQFETGWQIFLNCLNIYTLKRNLKS